MKALIKGRFLRESRVPFAARDRRLLVSRVVGVFALLYVIYTALTAHHVFCHVYTISDSAGAAFWALG